MESLDYWRLCDELSVMEAALLVAGIDPGAPEGVYVEQSQPQDQPKGYRAARAAIARALARKKIEGESRPYFDDFGNEIESVSVRESTVQVESLKSWLAGRGIRTGFFFPQATGEPDYLNPNDPRYAPKLAAAVRAWEAYQEVPGKTAKQALEKWLREHAAEYDLVDDDGNPNNQGIDEIAKVANWGRKGGVPRKPEANPPTD